VAVFADLGFPDAAERQAKLRLAYALNRVLEARNLPQADAAKVLRVTQSKVSALRHYKLAGFSVERLMNLLTALDQDVEIVIRQKPPRRRLVGSASSRLERRRRRRQGRATPTRTTGAHSGGYTSRNHHEL
jgi:predicted XRE-type DNA-binding protein